MCTWNKKHPDLFRQRPEQQKPHITTPNDEIIEENSSVERLLKFLQHPHV